MPNTDSFSTVCHCRACAGRRVTIFPTLLAKIPALSAEISKEAARRDLERELPFEAFRLFKEAGLGALRIPVSLGGPGGSVSRDYIDMIMAIGAADSNVAHALRSHFNFTESLILSPNTAIDRTQLGPRSCPASFSAALIRSRAPSAPAK